MLKKYKIAAVVVLYNPDQNIYDNIQTYYEGVDQLIVVDNSEVPNPLIKVAIDRLCPGSKYKYLEGNLGIAVALNVACRIAIDMQFSWILTMDQDSLFMKDQFSTYIDDIESVQLQFKNVGLISPHHSLHNNHGPKDCSQFEVKNIAMTSGNLVNLNIFERLGPFDEKLFMDYVDYEYCLRLRKNNYQIIQNNFICLRHSLGNFELKKIFNRKIAVSNHNALRRFYMTRNSLYVGFRYLKTDLNFFLNVLFGLFFWGPFVIIFFEENKKAKLKAVFNGTYDFLLNRSGKKLS